MPLTAARAPAGGMVLNAPGVISGVREREVEPPAPMRIAVGKGGGGGGRGRGISRRGKKGLGLPGRVAEGGWGGFPAVLHRSEMGCVKIGGAAAAARG